MNPARVAERDRLPAGSTTPMPVAVIGAGYVGLVQAAGLASLGHRVRLGEKDRSKLRILRSGGSPIFEPGLDGLLAEATASGTLSFHRSNVKAVADAEVVFLTLPTPSAPDGSVDTSILLGAVEDLADSLRQGAVMVIKSTVPVGTSRHVSGMKGVSARGISVVSNPEFLREGSAVKDFFEPDRIVIGASDPEAAQILASGIYRGLDAEVMVTDPASAEMIKYAANSYLAARLSFANSIANLCEEVGADATEVLAGMGRDHRIGSHYLQPGPGYGGSCLPKDTRGLLAMARASGYDFLLLRSVMEVNDAQKRRMVDRVVSAAGDTGDGLRVGVWGLSFKAGTGDVRESPAVEMAERLRGAGATVRAYDPQVKTPPTGVEPASDAVSAAEGADVLLVATEWGEFREVDLGAVRQAMRGSTVVDARNLLDRRVVESHGLSYRGVGSGR